MKVVKGEIKLQFSGDNGITIYLENLERQTLELLPAITKFNKVAVYKINIQK